MEIVVRVDQAGRLTVGGQFPNLVTALGMLEMAKTAIVQQAQKAAEPGVSVPNPSLARHLLNGSGG